LRYSHGEVVQLACPASSLPSLRSRRYRTPEHWNSLRPLLSRVFLIRTNASHLFFGSIGTILETAEQWLAQEHSGEKQFLLLDLASVQTIDTSALQVLRQNSGRAAVLLAGMRPEILELLLEADATKGLRFFSSLDAALEICEDQLLREAGFGLTAAPEPKRQTSMEPANLGRLNENMVRRLCETYVPKPLKDEEALALIGVCFPGLNLDQRRKLLQPRCSSRRPFVRGSVIAQQGTVCHGMFLCLRGTLAVYSGPVRLPDVVHEMIGIDSLVKRFVGPSSLDGNDSSAGDFCCELGPGDTCGAAALLSPLPVNFLGSVISRTECELLELERSQVLAMERSSDLSLALGLYKALALRALEYQEANLVGVSRGSHQKAFTDHDIAL